MRQICIDISWSQPSSKVVCLCLTSDGGAGAAEGNQVATSSLGGRVGVDWAEIAVRGVRLRVGGGSARPQILVVRTLIVYHKELKDLCSGTISKLKLTDEKPLKLTDDNGNIELVYKVKDDVGPPLSNGYRRYVEREGVRRVHTTLHMASSSHAMQCQGALTYLNLEDTIKGQRGPITTPWLSTLRTRGGADKKSKEKLKTADPPATAASDVPFETRAAEVLNKMLVVDQSGAVTADSLLGPTKRMDVSKSDPTMLTPKGKVPRTSVFTDAALQAHQTALESGQDLGEFVDDSASTTLSDSCPKDVSGKAQYWIALTAYRECFNNVNQGKAAKEANLFMQRIAPLKQHAGDYAAIKKHMTGWEVVRKVNNVGMYTLPDAELTTALNLLLEKGISHPPNNKMHLALRRAKELWSKHPLLDNCRQTFVDIIIPVAREEASTEQFDPFNPVVHTSGASPKTMMDEIAKFFGKEFVASCMLQDDTTQKIMLAEVARDIEQRLASALRDGLVSADIMSQVHELITACRFLHRTHEKTNIEEIDSLPGIVDDLQSMALDNKSENGFARITWDSAETAPVYQKDGTLS